MNLEEVVCDGVGWVRLTQGMCQYVPVCASDGLFKIL
jgi:hypothetical protein